MMNDSYIDEMKKRFPDVRLPDCGMGEDLLPLLEMSIQNQKVEKSKKLDTLEYELAVAEALLKKVAPVAEYWERKRREDDEKWKKAIPGNYFADHTYLPQWEWKDSDLDVIRRFVAGEIRRAELTLASNSEKMSQCFGHLHNLLLEAKDTLENGVDAERKGGEGETEVERYLSRRLMCRMLAGVVLPAVQESSNAAKTAETDLLIFASRGIYVCEIKNYGKSGQTLEVQPNGEIHKLSYNGRFLESMGNPVAQNLNHYKAVKRVLQDAGLANVPVIPVVLISNPDVNIENYSKHWVGDMYELCDLVSQQMDDTMDIQMIRKAYNAIKRTRLSERMFPVLEVSAICETVERALAVSKNIDDARYEWLRNVSPDVNQWCRDVYAGWEKCNPKFMRLVKFGERANTALTFSAFVWAIMAIVGGLLIFNSAPLRVLVLVVTSLAYFVWSRHATGKKFILVGKKRFGRFKRALLRKRAVVIALFAVVLMTLM